MAELSKTAAAAAKAVARGEAKKEEKRSNDYIIADLRNNRASGLHVSPTAVDVLFEEYDRTIKELKEVSEDRAQFSINNTELESQVKNLAAHVEELEKENAGLKTLVQMYQENANKTAAVLSTIAETNPPTPELEPQSSPSQVVGEGHDVVV
jgi:predicted nuclease with TOPRIM domain